MKSPDPRTPADDERSRPLFFFFGFWFFWKHACFLDQIAESRPAEAMRRTWQSHSKPRRHWLANQSAFSQKTQPSLWFSCWMRIGDEKWEIYFSLLCRCAWCCMFQIILNGCGTEGNVSLEILQNIGYNIGLKPSAAWQNVTFLICHMKSFFDRYHLRTNSWPVASSSQPLTDGKVCFCFFFID